MLRKESEHVVEKRHAGVDFRHARTVDRESERDVGFGGFTLYDYGAILSHASIAELTANISSSLPTLIRKKEAVKAWLGK